MTHAPPLEMWQYCEPLTTCHMTPGGQGGVIAGGGDGGGGGLMSGGGDGAGDGGDGGGGGSMHVSIGRGPQS